MSDKPIRILHVEDNRADAVLLQDMLESAGAGRFDILWRDRLQAALDCLAKERFDAVLLDLTLPDSHGLATLERVQVAMPALPLIIVTGVEDERVAMEAIHQGAQDYLIKGATDGRGVARAILYAIDRKRA
jgi:DNA-binding NtrC family response regulator